MIIIYHKPKCRIAGKCIKLLETKFNGQHDIRYEGLALSEEKLKEILKLLNYRPIDIIKTSQIIWKTLLRNLDFTDEELIKIILQYPSLLKNPIIINGNKAIIGRPPEVILDIL
ncbi:arsenate reductase family protein [Flavivirga aquimarina]|uniref:arsenate reductase family protein n=1 Tax=Flavivirga aquimarina TaxID=2027862 RepID=UPI00349ED698